MKHSRLRITDTWCVCVFKMGLLHWKDSAFITIVSFQIIQISLRLFLYLSNDIILDFLFNESKNPLYCPHISFFSAVPRLRVYLVLCLTTGRLTPQWWNDTSSAVWTNIDLVASGS